MTSVAPFSLDATIRALRTNTEDILPTLDGVEYNKIDEIIGFEGTADGPVRLNIPPRTTTDGGSTGLLIGAAKATAEYLKEVASETPFPSTAPPKIT